MRPWSEPAEEPVASLSHSKHVGPSAHRTPKKNAQSERKSTSRYGDAPKRSNEI
ncbi:hypothetical protein [Lysinibacillus sp. fls2-241-R2A-57]|uniref:hypothetical protein n=1 Tax=Lysinibacillus sp. fls2-241-R2A-57 TaxID=3040292 RepID=UPI0025526572|nr:hypothetical protein [Lysinibacillus sp. fls2-241-R2A-57]